MVNYFPIVRKFFENLPLYTPNHKQVLDELLLSLESPVSLPKGEIIKEMAAPNKDFFFPVEGYLKEMYKNSYSREEELFNIIPPGTIFVNEDTLYFNRRPMHYYVTYTPVTYFRLPYERYQQLSKRFPELQSLHLSASAEVQRNRRKRLTMLRMGSTSDRIKWVRNVRPELYKVMDRITLAQYIGVSRASLYRAFDKNDKSQY
jgi:CRP-like cAMP-binding protein